MKKTLFLKKDNRCVNFFLGLPIAALYGTKIVVDAKSKMNYQGDRTCSSQRYEFSHTLPILKLEL